MQEELLEEETPVEIRILGVNKQGAESGNSGMMAGRKLPWLQDDAETQVWTRWRAAWRDLVIVDTHNVRVSVYNLTQHGLKNADNYAQLKAMLLASAAGP